MNCAQFEDVVIEITRGALSDAAASRGVLAHADACARCARRLAQERRLSEALAVCGEQDENRAASPAVERALLTAFLDQRHSLRRRRSAWIASACAGAIAAVLFVAAVVALRRPESPRPVAAQPSPTAPKTQIIAPVYRQLEKPRARALRAENRKPAPRKAEAALGNREIVTDFLPVVYDPDPIERGSVVRVRLPRSALLAFGFPVNELRAEEPINADVLLGEDGLARAVRFVK